MWLTYTKIYMLTQLLLIVLIVIIFTNIDVDIDVTAKEKFAIPYGSRRSCDRCNNFYLGDRCLSPYCKREWWWFNDHTPLPWGNTSRTPKWYYPPYTYIQSYYDGWF